MLHTQSVQNKAIKSVGYKGLKSCSQTQAIPGSCCCSVPGYRKGRPITNGWLPLSLVPRNPAFCVTAPAFFHPARHCFHCCSWSQPVVPPHELHWMPWQPFGFSTPAWGTLNYVVLSICPPETQKWHHRWCCMSLPHAVCFSHASLTGFSCGPRVEDQGTSKLVENQIQICLFCHKNTWNPCTARVVKKCMENGL